MPSEQWPVPKNVSDGLVLLCREALLKKRQSSSSSSSLFQGGSSGKGTALKDRSDADLVVFLSPLTSFQEQFERRGEFIQEIRKQLEACQQQRRFTVSFEVQPKFLNPRALSFTLKSPSSQVEAEVEFDVLPAYDVLGERPDTSDVASVL